MGALPISSEWTLLTVISTERFRCQGADNISLHLSRCRVALRPAVLSVARIWPSVSRYLEIFFGLREPSHQAFTSFGEVGVHRPAWGGNADGAIGILRNAGRVWTPALCLDPQKRPCAAHVRWVGWSSNTADQYRCYPKSTRLLTFSM